MVERVLAWVAAVAALTVLGLILRPALLPGRTSPLAIAVAGTDVRVDASRARSVYLEYGPTRRYGLFTSAQGPTHRHLFSLAALAPGTYHVRAVVAGRHASRSPDATLVVPARRTRAAAAGRPAGGRKLPAALLATFGPALAAPAAAVTLENTGVDVFATRRNGALAVFALNTTPSSPVQQIFSVPGLAGRTVEVWESGNVIEPDGDSFADTLPPHAWRVYLVPPRAPRSSS